ncbi:MAG TPA: tRNA lysidine(34) synthetase TilS [Aeromonadales bacterium]|nr:tRNA lysidine(34) synthetase TilS [Aeromonadales bacterium]
MKSGGVGSFIANKNKSEKELLEDVSNFLNQNIPSETRTVWVGFSGGLDSTVLLYLIKKIFKQKKIKKKHLQAIHINHKLQSEAVQWEQHCQKVCDDLNISLIVEEVSSIQVNGHGLEQAAREERFNLFEKNIEENDVLCLGHHLQDQAETFLFRAIRGSGLHGLAAMESRQQRGAFVLLKPFLGTARKTLEMIARKNKLEWIEDPSNNINNFDRNFLRNEIFKPIRSRWHDIDSRFAKVADLCREQAGLLNDLASVDARMVKLSGNNLSIDALQQLSAARIRNLLTWWFRSENLQIPSRLRVNEIQQTLSTVKPDGRFEQNIGPYQLRQSGRQLFLIPTELSANIQNQLFEKNIVKKKDYLQLTYSFAVFEIIIELKSKGIENIPDNSINIKFGIDQKSIFFKNNQFHKTIKNIFQENNIPIWLRDKLPCLYHDEVVYAICGIGNLKQERQTEALVDLTTTVVVKWGLSGHFKITDEIF